MELLLDTHTFIWFINGERILPPRVKALIADTNNTCFVSIASIWEIAIKQSLNKLHLQSDFNNISLFLLENDIEILPITFAHIQNLTSLPYHHRDPFDRIIIAQGIAENITILTKDINFKKYSVKILWT